MTVIVAARDGKSCAIGADSGIYDDDDTGNYIVSGEKKIWKQGVALIGYADSPLLQELVKKSGKDNPYEIRDFIQEKQKDSGDKDLGEVIIVTPDSIYTIGGDGSVVKHGALYAAIGAASSVALGSFASCGDLPALEMVKRSVAAAGKHNVYVRQPYVFLTSEKKGKK